MSLPSDLADLHQRRRIEATDRATLRALRLWRQIDPEHLDTGWNAVSPLMVGGVAAAQVAAAEQSTAYMNSVDMYYGRDNDARVVAAAFGGVTIDGRELGPAMYGAVT